MEFKGTKGDWEYRNDVVDRGFYIETVDKSHQNTFIGDVGGGLQSKQEIEANAKLIASSPALLEALRELVQLKEWKDKYGKEHHYLKSKPIAWGNAKKAIEKALL